MAAEQAVKETGITRSILSLSSLVIPASMLATVSLVGMMPQAAFLKTLVEMSAVMVSLRIGLPGSQALFPPVSSMPGKEIESDLKTKDQVYFNKGL